MKSGKLVEYDHCILFYWKYNYLDALFLSIYAIGEQCSDDKGACKKCTESLDLRDNCIAAKDSLASTTSTKLAAEKLKNLGFINIKYLFAGLNGWLDAGGALVKEKVTIQRKLIKHLAQRH